MTTGAGGGLVARAALAASPLRACRRQGQGVLYTLARTPTGVYRLAWASGPATGLLERATLEELAATDPELGLDAAEWEPLPINLNRSQRHYPRKGKRP